MKSKLTNFLLAGAFIFAASSTFVSCKDYESDDIQQVKYDVSNLDANMQNEVNALNKRIDRLEECIGCLQVYFLRRSALCRHVRYVAEPYRLSGQRVKESSHF